MTTKQQINKIKDLLQNNYSDIKFIQIYRYIALVGYSDDQIGICFFLDTGYYPYYFDNIDYKILINELTFVEKLKIKRKLNV